MADLSDFRLRISAKLGLNNDPAFDQPLLDSWVNEAVSEVLTRSRVNVSVATVTFTPGSYDYILPTQILALDEVYVTDVTSSLFYRMNRVSPQEILNYRIGTQFQGAPPVRFYALSGTSLLMVYPTPLQADTLTLYYVPRPATLAASGDTPSDIPVEWHKCIEYYGLWQGGQYVNDSPSQNGAAFEAMYEAELAKLKRAALHRGGRRLSPAVVGRSAQRFPIGQPSQQEV